MSAVNRDTKTQATLIALARTRRVQRARAHAFLHRNAPLPTLRASLGYMTTTARVTDDATSPGHRMTVLGVARFEGVAYIVEDLGAADAPIVYRLYLRGPRQGHLVPLHAWYEQSDDVHGIHARIAALAPTLEPGLPVAPEAWMLSTRIVQRRALRMTTGTCSDLPIRKFALQLVVEPVSEPGASGRSTVTAFLRPDAELTAVWSIDGAGDPAGDPSGARSGKPSGEPSPGSRCSRPDAGPDLAIARVTFTGIPSGTGRTKDTVVLLTSRLHGMDDSFA